MKALTFYPILGVDRLSGPAIAETLIAKPSQAFEKILDAWRQVEQALSRVGRHVANSRTDPPLQSFWRGVERDLEAEAHQLALRVGAEAIRLCRIPTYGGIPAKSPSQPLEIAEVNPQDSRRPRQHTHRFPRHSRGGRRCACQAED